MMQTRIMETMLLFVVDTLSSSFNNTKKYMNDTILKGKSLWINSVNEYRTRLGITWDDLRVLNRDELKEKIRDYDTSMWLEGLQEKTSLKWYLQGKQNIAYENCYRNNGHSAFVAKVRTDSLQLEDHLGRGKPHYDKTCKLCGVGEENLKHILLKCKELESERNRRIMEGPDMAAKKRP